MEITTIILAAGFGTRMRSEIPKVMHKIAGKQLLSHILSTVKQIGSNDVRIIASQQLINFKESHNLADIIKFRFIEQKEKLGTAHAVSIGLDTEITAPLLVLNGDVPMIEAKTLNSFIETFISTNADVACLAFRTKKPTGYGRLITYEQDLIEIVEEKEATAEQKQIKLCNSGVFLIKHEKAKNLIDSILAQDLNKKLTKEHYLPDIVRLAHSQGMKCIYSLAPYSEVVGINDKAQLAKAEKILQKRLRKRALDAGVTMIDPESVYLSADVVFGNDVLLHQSVIIGENVKIGNNVEILPFSHIEQSLIGNDCKVGPFARLRPGTVLKGNNRVGNFVEVKASMLDEGVKASHLTYIGDASIGKNTNIGAGTIFCNYDGFSKYKTIIGEEVFVGSNSALIAPLEIKSGAIIGAGSVINEDVEENALSIGRARQVNYAQKADLIKAMKADTKSQK